MRAEGDAPISVVVCDDDPYAIQALPLLLDDPEIELVAMCGSPDTCIAAIQRQPPRVAMIDLQQRGNGRAGIELIHRIGLISPATICLIFTGSDAHGELLPDAFLAGAHGFRRKGYTDGDDLPDMVKRLAAGEWEIDRELAQVLFRAVSPDAGDAAEPRDLPAGPCLSTTEYEVLRLIAEDNHADTIARELQISKADVHTYIRNIIGKYHLSASRSLSLCSIVPDRVRS